MKNLKSLVFVTAHDPLSRFDALLSTLRGYAELPGTQDVFIYIDWEHRNDEKQLKELLEPNVSFNSLNIVVASEIYEGYSLTWAHKGLLREAVRNNYYDIYVYTENDMIFTSEHFLYWYNHKESLKKLNLEPGFCRYEVYKDKFVPFDNHRRWNLNGLTPSVWADRPYQVESYIAPYSEFLGFISLGNPYMGMMILDQDMANRYIESQSADPLKSFELTQFRCWPIADRSSMGLAFENLRDNQEHRRVVPLIKTDKGVEVAPCGLIEHRDTKYSRLLEKNEVLLDISDMLVLS